jgi:ATP phosphoribosyltransferase
VTLVIALPSKGRLKEQTEAWLADVGFRLEIEGGERGYRAALRGLPGAEVRLLSAGDIAGALDGGEVHLGVTGEDLLRERGEGLDARVRLLRGLGFGRADLVVAAPKSWLDVETMADVEAVAHDQVARTGRRLRVATKYLAQTRGFFARKGVADYRIVESLGATEGAPAAGLAELVVDITTTGATLEANGLRILSDGLVLRSQAQLAANLDAGAAGDRPSTGVRGGSSRPRPGAFGPELAAGAGQRRPGGRGPVRRGGRLARERRPGRRRRPVRASGRAGGGGRRSRDGGQSRLRLRSGLPDGGCARDSRFDVNVKAACDLSSKCQKSASRPLTPFAG